MVCTSFTSLGKNICAQCRYGALTMVFRKSVRQFKRMNAIAKSPLYTHVQNTVTGLATIAAYRRQDEYLYVFGLLAGALGCCVRR